MRKPLVIAHRGLSRKYPENTLPAFEAAVALGADMLELDVTLTRDGHFVVIHDDTLPRTTDGSGFVCHHSLEELQAKHITNRGAPVEGVRIPSLLEVLDSIADKIRLNIEIKPFFPLRKAQDIQHNMMLLVKQLRRRGLLSSTIVSSSNFFVLEHLRELNDELRLGIIFRRPLTDFNPQYVCELLRASSFHPYYRQVTAELVDSMHELSVQVYPYTVNKAKRMGELLDLGVDGFFTDEPKVLQKVIAARV